MKKQKSPCIDICKFIGPNGWCLGCARTRDEAKKWKKLKPYDIEIMHKTQKKEWKLSRTLFNFKSRLSEEIINIENLFIYKLYYENL